MTRCLKKDTVEDEARESSIQDSLGRGSDDAVRSRASSHGGAVEESGDLLLGGARDRRDVQGEEGAGQGVVRVQRDGHAVQGERNSAGAWAMGGQVFRV